MKQRVVITGADGQLGRALRQLLPDAVATDHHELDITNPKALSSFDWSDVGIIINAAAYTNVDEAESAEGRRAAWRINAQAVGYLSRIATEHDITLVHVSTDYVFDGSVETHDEDEEPSPLNTYGTSKAAGDIAASTTPKHYIVRTSWVIGEGKNFVRTMLALSQDRDELTIVHDQIGRLTFTKDLAAGIVYLLNSGASFGTYNLTNDGRPASWADITREIISITSRKVVVHNTTTKQYFAGKSHYAARPLESTLKLDKIKATGFTPRPWDEALKQYINQEA